ncbi:MAG: NAD(P)-binding domain-containing protein [Pirellulaceae bacterium]|nr:NAD(P)-binding domain-containing protein [Pirellulaceae bacterium]
METGKYCVIGAGPSGLAALKNLAERGIPVEGLEREDDVGGNWYYGRPNSSVYASTHLISSKRTTEYIDFPMPKEYPPYPSHAQALSYLRAYARQHQLYDRIRFGTSVARVEFRLGGDSRSPTWLVTTDRGETREYAGLVVANGHHWDPLWPQVPGEFTGRQMHAHDYKTPEVLAGRRVLVIGAGNTGCDIAVEAAQHASSTLHSLRRGYHFLPKFLFGRPVDSGAEWFQRRRFPRWLQRWLIGWMVRIAAGNPERFGLPRPDHRLFESHPIINSQLFYYLGHGRIQVRPGIERLCGTKVRFVDGREDEVDLIVWATGYRISFPFLESRLVLDEVGYPRLFLNAFHPDYDNFFVAGLIQPNSGQWGITDWQCRLMAAFIAAQQQAPAKADRFRKLKAGRPENTSGGIRYVPSPRHILEVEYYSYRERLKKLVQTL